MTVRDLPENLTRAPLEAGMEAIEAEQDAGLL